MRLKAILLWGISIGLCSQLTCAEVEYSKKYDRCMDVSGGVTSEMMNCMGDEIQRQDVKLNREYQALMANLSQTRKTALRDVQRAWIKYRDLNCDFYADPNAGTMAMLNAKSCYLEQTAQRAQELNWLKEAY